MENVYSESLFHLEFYFISIGRSGRVWIMRSNIDPNFAVELETPPNTTSQIQIQMQIQHTNSFSNYAVQLGTLVKYNNKIQV